MKPVRLAFLFALALTLPAAAQAPAPRIKGRIVDFDGLTFHLAPEKGPSLAIRLQAHTQFMVMEKRTIAALKVGSYAGATVSDTSGTLTAEEVHLYPDSMRGSSEGRVALGGNRSVVSGAVTAVAPGGVTLFYRGGGMEAGVCQGRANPSSPSPACTGDAAIHVPADAVITALVPADKRMLVVGAVATVTVETDAKGVRSTPGVILEKP